MGAIEQDGYVFETEYSVMLQKGAIHVSKNGEYIRELAFTFTGNQPDATQIEKLIENFFS
ncbi:hypothetical protein FZW96_15890 [Bacillus sp. BGMRC 2118]|nr:hypothetical protein FZW96_15890 [Bacillus sp. BGMRC 2118]